MTHEVPPLSPLVREFLDRERDVPSLPAPRRDRAVARARSAKPVGAGSAFLRPAALFRARWAVPAALAFTAAAFGATLLEWRGRPSSGPSSPAPVVPAQSGVARSGAAPEPPNVQAGGPPAVVVAEVPSRSSGARGAEEPGLALALAPRPPARAAFPDELRLLAPAREALARREYGAVLAAVAEHARHFREGRLVEEREALRVKALAGVGRVKEARSAADAFRQRFPRSVLLSALDAAPAAE